MEQNNTHDKNGDNTSTVTAPIGDTDSNTTEQETSMTWNMNATPVLAVETIDGFMGTHVDDGREGEGQKMTDSENKEQPSRQKSDKQTQDIATEISSMAFPLTEKPGRNDNEDTPMEENDTSTTPITT
jgi:hypothetical protein